MALPSFPSINVSGVVHHYVRITSVGGSQEIYALGQAEVTPQMTRLKHKQRVMNDIAGKTLPFQKTYDGEDARVSVLLSRFSNLAWGALLEQDESLGGLIPIAGQESRWARGSLVYGQTSFELWQVYDNFFAPAGVDVGENLEIGWYWPQVEIVEHDTIAAGTQAEKLMLVFECTAYWIDYEDTSGDYGPPGGWLLYSNNPAFFPAAVTTVGAPQ
jgi:hypothetical protein